MTRMLGGTIGDLEVSRVMSVDRNIRRSSREEMEKWWSRGEGVREVRDVAFR